MISLSGKTAFITGGSRGIGAEICRLFKECGADVIAPTRKELDLSKRESIQNYIMKNNIKPDIFVHSAGINKLAGIEEIDYDILDEVFQVNCFSAISLMNSFSAKMKKNQYGRVVMISSLYAYISRERRLAYSSSKNAINGFVKSTAIELAKDNILINAVAPGYVMTDMTRKNLGESEIRDIKNKIPTGRFQSETDIANACLFLCSDMNQSITGQLMIVDGGFSLL